jgi:hypothetical protein
MFNKLLGKTGRLRGEPARRGGGNWCQRMTLLLVKLRFRALAHTVCR